MLQQFQCCRAAPTAVPKPPRKSLLRRGFVWRTRGAIRWSDGNQTILKISKKRWYFKMMTCNESLYYMTIFNMPFVHCYDMCQSWNPSGFFMAFLYLSPISPLLSGPPWRCHSGSGAWAHHNHYHFVGGYPEGDPKLQMLEENIIFCRFLRHTILRKGGVLDWRSRFTIQKHQITKRAVYYIARWIPMFDQPAKSWNKVFPVHLLE